jgi:tRNA(His) guanylyltransferase
VTHHDALGTRMKERYELRARQYLPRRTYTVLRLDGRAFHTYTRDLQRPFDAGLRDDLVRVAWYLCREVSGAALAFCQSDEISLVVTDFATPHTEAWFDGNVQKMVSIAAGVAAARFNELRPGKVAVFDARAFTIPDPIEVENYLIWRQRDATRNSITAAAQAHFSHRELQGKTGDEMRKLLWRERGVDWDAYPTWFKRGTLLTPRVTTEPVTWVDQRTGETRVAEVVERRTWAVEEPPTFIGDRAYLTALLPRRDAV